ncbi:CTP pyrophosphohydrolase [Mycobacterium marinum]|nr:CTP pyrophosphohydrolase [Mycobacterium marinum]
MFRLPEAGLARSQGCGGAGSGVLGQHGFGRIAVRRIWELALPGRLGEIPSLAMPNQPNQIVVAGAIICGGTVLVAQRVRPPELAGRWELPGGKVADGETEPAALARELGEELGLGVDDVAVGERLGADVVLDEKTILRAYRVRLLRGHPCARDHRALRWVMADQLDDVDWVPADRCWLADLDRALRPVPPTG